MSSQTPPKHPTPPKELIDIQNWFGNAVTNTDISGDLKIKTEASSHLKMSSRQSEEERLSIYMSDYWPRCIESLAEDFPLLKTALGETQFEAWMKRYLSDCPSTSFTLFHLGKALPQYLNDHYTTPNSAVIRTIAEYEWAKVASYIAEEKPRFNPDLLSESQKQQLSEISLPFQPSVNLIRLYYPIQTIESPEDVDDLSPEDIPVIIFRNNYVVQEMILDPLFYETLVLLKERHPISSAINILSDSLSSKQLSQVSKNITTWFGQCVQNNWFSEI